MKKGSATLFRAVFASVHAPAQTPAAMPMMAPALTPALTRARARALSLALTLALALAIPAPAAHAADGSPAWYDSYAPYVATYRAIELGTPISPDENYGDIARRHSLYFGAVKYALYDINGNGSPELIVGKSVNFSEYYACDVYTVDGGSVAHLISGGWESDIKINTRSIYYGDGYVVGYDYEYSILPDGRLFLEYRLGYDLDNDKMVSEVGKSLNDTPANLDWKQISAYTFEFVASQGGVPSDWAMDEVSAAIDAGLVPPGLQQNYTSPVSRGSVAGMFIDLIEKSSGQSTDALLEKNGAKIDANAFDDTNDAAVLAAHALGIINGVGDRRFDPGGTLTRAQAAAIINRTARLLGEDTNGYGHMFIDVRGHWSNAELGWPYQARIISGVGDDRFDPDAELTCEQAILIAGRALASLSEAVRFRTENSGFDVINIGSVVVVADGADAADASEAADAADAADAGSVDAYAVYESLIEEWKL